jgi:hypothetical protein
LQKHLHHKLVVAAEMVRLLSVIMDRQVVVVQLPLVEEKAVTVAEQAAELAQAAVVVLLGLLNLLAVEVVALRVVGIRVVPMVLMVVQDTLLLRIHNENSFII